MTELRAFGWALLCSVVTGIIVHFLTKDRDAEMRKAILANEAELRRRAFASKLLHWRFTLERKAPHQAWETYVTFAADLLAEAEWIASDFASPNEFRALVKRAGEWEGNQVGDVAKDRKCSVRDVLVDSIRAVYDFIAKASPDGGK